MAFSTKVRQSSQLLSETFTLTTTGNVDDLDFGNAAMIRVNNASLTTIRGLKAGQDGQRVAIVAVGAGEVDLAHQNAGSAAANRLINNVTSGVTPLVGGAGSAAYQYDATTARWRLLFAIQGAAIVPAYSGGQYTASTGTWTVDAGDVSALTYILDGNTLFVTFAWDTTSVSGGQAQLRWTLPNGWTAKGTVVTPCFSNDNAAGWKSDTSAEAVDGLTFLVFQPAPFGAGTWSAATNTTQVRGGIQFNIN